MRDSICKDCANRTRCDMAEMGRSPIAISTCYCYEKGNPTNADRIRAMTDEELATVIAWPYLASPPWCANHTTCPYISEDPTPCDKCALEWLKQEANE